MQLAMPAGEEQSAREFYAGILGMTEVDKPPALKGHPGILVTDLDAVAQRLQSAGQDVRWDGEFPGYRRVYASDPFGNRLEFLEPAGESTG